MATVVHFDVPADDPQRAKEFYQNLFGWKFTRFEGMEEFYLVETTALDGSPGTGGGLGRRGAPDQRIMNYFGVADLDASIARVESLGGTITMPKTAVPGFGSLAICMDTEGNPFGLWEEDETAT
ncbi:MAG TPA: VOC family protein [Methanoculleus sp.]|nr:VOC family protein [Methanoculleus sp.]